MQSVALASVRGVVVTARRGARRVVVDASVVLKWVFDDEGYVAQARALRDAGLIDGALEFHAPVLLPYELTNAVRSAVVNDRIPAAVAAEALTILLEAPIELHETDPLAALEIALRIGASGYDASYVALAARLGVECWSADQPLVQAGQRGAPFMRPISEYEA